MAALRVTQQHIQVLVKSGAPKLRVTQQHVQVLVSQVVTGGGTTKHRVYIVG